MVLRRLRRAALVAAALIVSACLQAPPLPEPPDSTDPPIAAEVPDAGMPGAPLRTCDEQFGSAPDYELCAETGDTCSFVSDAGDNDFNCDQLCGELGATCVSAFDTNGMTCVAGAEDSCDSPHQSQICVCLRS